MISPEQCRAARALIGWSQTDLMNAAELTQATLSAFEKGVGGTRASNIEKVKNALEVAGVVFVDANEASDKGGAGVRLQR